MECCLPHKVGKIPGNKWLDRMLLQVFGERMSDPDCFVWNGSLLILLKCEEEKAIRESVGKGGLFGKYRQ